MIMYIYYIMLELICYFLLYIYLSKVLFAPINSCLFAYEQAIQHTMKWAFSLS